MNATKRRIIRKASRLFIQNGIKNTSLADIANATGISKGTLYYHYSSKDDLIIDVALSHLHIVTSEVLKCVRTAGTNDSKSIIIKRIVKKIETIGTRGHLHMYLLCEAIMENNELSSKFKLYYNEWRNKLKSELSLYFDDNDCEPIAVILISLVDGLIVQGLLGTDPIDFKNLSGYLINNLFPTK